MKTIIIQQVLVHEGQTSTIPFFKLANPTEDQIQLAQRIIDDFNEIGKDERWINQDGATLGMSIEE